MSQKKGPRAFSAGFTYSHNDRNVSLPETQHHGNGAKLECAEAVLKITKYLKINILNRYTRALMNMHFVGCNWTNYYFCIGYMT